MRLGVNLRQDLWVVVFQNYLKEEKNYQLFFEYKFTFTLNSSNMACLLCIYAAVGER